MTASVRSQLRDLSLFEPIHSLQVYCLLPSVL